MTWWLRRPVPSLALSLDMLGGVPCTEGTFGDIGYLLQTYESLTLGIWFGPGQDLAGFRASFGPAEPVTFDAETRTTVAGRPARRQTGRVTRAVATGLILEPDGSTGHVTMLSGDVTHVAVAWTRHEVAALLRWQVATSEREHWRRAEKHFLRSVRLLA